MPFEQRAQFLEEHGDVYLAVTERTPPAGRRVGEAARGGRGIGIEEARG